MTPSPGIRPAPPQRSAADDPGALRETIAGSLLAARERTRLLAHERRNRDGQRGYEVDGSGGVGLAGQRDANALEQRAARGDRQKFLAVLESVPDIEPEEYDRI